MSHSGRSVEPMFTLTKVSITGAGLVNSSVSLGCTRTCFSFSVQNVAQLDLLVINAASSVTFLGGTMNRFWGLSLALLSAGAWAQATPKPTVVVAGIKAPPGFTGAQALTDELRTQVARHGRYRLVTPEETQAVDAELERQLAQGCEDPSCVNEIGGSLGAQFVITGQIQRLGSGYTFTVKLVEIETVTARQAASVRAERVAGFADRLPNLVTDLLGARSQSGYRNAGAGWGRDTDAEGDRLLESAMASDEAFDERQRARRDRMLRGSGNQTPGASCSSALDPSVAIACLVMLMMRRRRALTG